MCLTSSSILRRQHSDVCWAMSGAFALETDLKWGEPSSWDVTNPGQAGVSHKMLPREIFVSYDGPAGGWTQALIWAKPHKKYKQCVPRQMSP